MRWKSILQRLADFKEKSQTLKRRVKGAMVYPIVVILVAMTIVGGILYFIIPKFELIFKDFGVDLPWMTRFLIDASHVLLNKFWIVLLVPTLIWIFIKLMYRNRTGAYLLDKLWLFIPVMGQIIEKSTVARTMRTLGTLVQSGVPILESLNIVRDTAGNAVFERAFTRIYESIREGETIAQPLRESRIVDDIVVNMIDVGEETGDLDTMLNKIADNYEEEVEVLVDSLVSLLEPIMIVVLGGIIGFIVIALFMPLDPAHHEALGLRPSGAAPAALLRRVRVAGASVTEAPSHPEAARYPRPFGPREPSPGPRCAHRRPTHQRT